MGFEDGREPGPGGPFGEADRDPAEFSAHLVLTSRTRRMLVPLAVGIAGGVVLALWRTAVPWLAPFAVAALLWALAMAVLVLRSRRIAVVAADPEALTVLAPGAPISMPWSDLMHVEPVLRSPRGSLLMLVCVVRSGRPGRPGPREIRVPLPLRDHASALRARDLLTGLLAEHPHAPHPHPVDE
ncbi:hypothetical protein ACN20G_15650 [Streptomyces sp. BI20]|uniref:hypothetical protein n=1 Tax=Streptomyces sp. BI20 TaxID=3403460 RepID=UPI003C70CE6E